MDSPTSSSALGEYSDVPVEGEGHGHSHSGGGHGHSHGEKKKKEKGHGHSHGEGHGHAHGEEKKKREKGHGHSHDEGHGHSHGNYHDDHHNHDSHNENSLSEPLNSSPESLLGSPVYEDSLFESVPLAGSKTIDEMKKQKKARLALTICLVLTTIFMIGEVVGGYMANSLAIMTDAAHLLTDIGAMFLSFGFHRAEILGALASVLMIWALTGVLIYEAIQRVLHPPDVVDGKIMFIIATCGLAINIIDAIILHYGAGGHGHSHGGGGGHSHGAAPKKKKKSGHGHLVEDHGHSHGGGGDHGHAHGNDEIDIENGVAKKKEHMNINVYSAYIHVIGDCFQSIGVMIASAIIWIKPHWKIADPITTFIFSIIVLFTTVRLLKQSLSVLMEGVPSEIDVAEVQDDLGQLRGVTEVHDLHIWSITIGKPALSAHLTIGEGVNADEVLRAANQLLLDTHSIAHTTIQIELPAKEAMCRDSCKPPRKGLIKL
eukprot:gene9104-10676_t